MDYQMTDLKLAKKKAEHYCSYQERSQQEVREKLYSFKLFKNQVEQIISELIQDNYINEERFAVQFAGGKFRIKGWGRIKINAALKQKRISDYCIKKALNTISESDYKNKLKVILQKKIGTLTKSENTNWQAAAIYCIGKGYESEIVWETVKELKDV